MGDLRVRIGDDERSFTSGQVVRIGRDPGSTVRTENPNVSRNHASVAEEDGTWVLRDTGSSQGTFHDGQRVQTIEIRGTVHLTLGLEGRGQALVLETAELGPAPERPGGNVNAVDLQASTEIVGVPGPAETNPETSGTVIEPEGRPLRPASRVESPGGEAVESLETVITGDEIRLECAGRSYRFLPHQQIRVGRDPSCEIMVSNPTVSRVHAVIYHDGTGWILTDPGSSTGVFRDGGRISAAQVVGPSAVWLGDEQTGERLIMTTAAAPPKPPRSPADQNQKYLIALIVALAAVALLVVAVAVVAFVFLSRT